MRNMKKSIAFHLGYCSIHAFFGWVLNCDFWLSESITNLVAEGRQLHKKKKEGRIEKYYFSQKAKNAFQQCSMREFANIYKYVR